MQARRDALAKVRAGETVWLALSRGVGGQKVLVRALAADEDPSHCYVLVLINRRLRAGFCTPERGGRFKVFPRCLRRNDILGIVLEVREP
jgi:hypothetical protein